jgi:hypothetical protein
VIQSHALESENSELEASIGGREFYDYAERFLRPAGMSKDSTFPSTSMNAFCARNRTFWLRQQGASSFLRRELE